MNLLRFEISDVRLEQRDVPVDDVDATFTAGLHEITRGAIGKVGCACAFRASSHWTRAISMWSRSSACSCVTAPMRRPIRIPRYLIDEPSAVREDGDAWCACRGHELLPWAEEHFRKGL